MKTSAKEDFRRISATIATNGKGGTVSHAVTQKNGTKNVTESL